MKISPVFTVVVFAFSLALPVSARVGETEAQCITRYGKPVRTIKTTSGYGDKALAFRKSNFDVLAVFDKGRAVSVTYSCTVKSGKKEAIAAPEQMKLMQNNGGSKKWEKLAPTKADDKYETTDGKLRGRYNRAKKYLEVCDADWNKSVAKLEANRAKAATEVSRDLEGL